MAVSLVIDPGLVATATGQLADIGASIGETAAAASAPTTQIAVAASDEVSAAVARLFGTLGAEFQQANAQAAAFHAEFVRVLSTSAAAYIGAEIANAEKQLLDTSAAAAATDPLGGLLGSILGGGTSTSGTGLGGLLGGSGGLLDPILFGGTGGLLGPLIGGNGVLTSLVGNGPFGSILNSAGQQFGAGISALIGGTGGQFLTGQLQGLGSLLFPGLFPTTGVVTTAPAVGGAWQQPFINTGNNLAALNAAFAADPFPLLRQIVANQQGYAMQIGAELAYVAQHPALVGQASLAYLMSGGPALAVQTAVNGTLSGTAGNWQTLSTSFSAFNRDLSANLAHFPSDWAKVNQDLATGQYHLAVTDGTSAVLNVFLSGFDTHNLADIKLVGPVGDLFPVISLPGQNLSGLSTLMPAHSVPAQMTNNLGRFFTALADTSVSTTISGTVNPRHWCWARTSACRSHSCSASRGAGCRTQRARHRRNGDRGRHRDRKPRPGGWRTGRRAGICVERSTQRRGNCGCTAARHVRCSYPQYPHRAHQHSGRRALALQRPPCPAACHHGDGADIRAWDLYPDQPDLGRDEVRRAVPTVGQHRIPHTRRLDR